ncbi:MAG TPA: hypothetical protein DER26_06935, partial [Verrucomicrobia bacterium]|nr:hypothetical protein [Verrucomicrobiota bacterium]
MRVGCFGSQKRAILETKIGLKTPRKTDAEEHRDAGNKLQGAFKRLRTLTLCLGLRRFRSRTKAGRFWD